MRMTMKLNALAAAVGLSFALGAHAAPIVTDLAAGTGGGTGEGNLVLAMWDGGTKSLVFNTGLTVNGADVSKSFEAQKNHNIHVAIAPSDLAAIDGYLGDIDTTKLRWNLTAISNVIGFDGDGNPDWTRIGLLTTGVKGSPVEPTIANGPPNVDPALDGAPFSNAKSFYDAQSPGLASGNVARLNTQAGAGAYDGNWNGNFGGVVSFNNEGKLGDALSFYFYHGVGIDPNVVSSDLFPGKWTFGVTAGHASLDYVVPAAPVPVPGAVWLLGSGIAALAARRRQAS